MTIELVDERDTIAKAVEKEIKSKFSHSGISESKKHEDTFCHVCRSVTTKVYKGNPAWYKFKIDKDGKFDKRGSWNGDYICSDCYSNNGKERPHRLKRSDFETRLEYANAQAQRLGYKSEAERFRIRRWEKGIQNPIDDANDSPSHFGVCIGERYVSLTFDNPIMMPYGNPGYDWECKNGLKIQHEARCLCKSECSSEGTRPQFKFTHINYNKVADVFILSGWKDRESLEPLFVWAFKKDDIVRGEPFWMRDSLSITFSSDGIKAFEDFEVTNRLDKLKEICDKFIKK